MKTELSFKIQMSTPLEKPTLSVIRIKKKKLFLKIIQEFSSSDTRNTSNEQVIFQTEILSFYFVYF
jgi:hypothetical protein